MDPKNEESAAAFLSNIASSSDGSWSNFIWCFVVLVSSPSQVITTTTIEMLDSLIMYCSIKVRFALVKTNLIHQIINTLNPQSLPLAEAVDIHINIMRIIRHLILVATPNGLAELRLKDGDEQQAVHETVLQRVLAPSEKYFCHLCMNHFSIIDGKLCDEFMYLLAWPVEICPYYQPTMDLILHMPVFITIPSCLTFFENDTSIRNFLHVLGISQREWNKAKGEERQMGKKVQRMLRMEESDMSQRSPNTNSTLRSPHSTVSRPSSSLSPDFNTTLLLRRHSSILDDKESLLFMLVDFRHFINLMLSSHSFPTLPPHSGSHSLDRPFGRRLGRIGRCRHRIDRRSSSLLLRHPHPPTPLCLSLTTHTLPLPSASPSPPTPSHSPLPLPHHPHPPTPSASPSPPTPSHSPLPLPHHPHPPTPLCLSLTTHTLPLPSASPSPLHTLPLPLPLPHHPHPPTPSASPSPPTPSHSLCLSLTTHTLPLPLPLPHHPHPPTPSASPSPPTPSHSLCLSLTTHTLPLLCLSLTTHTLPLPSASPSPPTPSHSPLPLPHHPLSLLHLLEVVHSKQTLSCLQAHFFLSSDSAPFLISPNFSLSRTVSPLVTLTAILDTGTERNDPESDEERCHAEAVRGRAVWGE
ncbi:hypothetical protein BLNAU_17008 [Blattamonas nauphoetae]|uniref:Uncharacterized protein n=1 Tax=Blattamonas nauphoetae TaxID=2049346 RepID=A0ABQ9X7U5_9EUKA|nr:hypothetical protein BLNAU_17008 [Blattamonas nauphoetae]